MLGPLRLAPPEEEAAPLEIECDCLGSRLGRLRFLAALAILLTTHHILRPDTTNQIHRGDAP